MTPQISIVMPAFNESHGIRAAIEEVRVALLDQFDAAELIVVDDGSTDGTTAILQAETDMRIRVIHQQNQGHGAALNAGVASARADVIMVIDADQPIALALMLPWVRRVVGGTSTAVMALRQGRCDGVLRVALSLGLSVALFLRFGRWVPDANVPCKIMPRAAWVAAKSIPSAITAAHVTAERVPVRVRDTGAGARLPVLWRTAVGALRAIYS